MFEAIGFILSLLGLLFAFERPRQTFVRIFRWNSSGDSAAQASENWIARVNALFSGEVQIICQPSREPTLHLEGEYQLTAQQMEEAAKQRTALKAEGRPNDMHAILVEEPAWQAATVHMRIRTIDYAGIVALRKEGLHPAVLSSCALVLSQEMGQILLHRRATNVATYPSCLHIIGGGYMPPSHHGRDDGDSLRSTAEREVLEETKLALPPAATPPMILAREVTTGFIQLVFLGFDVPASAVARLKGNWEGHVEAIPYEHLPELLQESGWVPSGKAHVLAWLALGAPGAGGKPRFGNLSPNHLFDELVSATSAEQTLTTRPGNQSTAPVTAISGKHGAHVTSNE